MTVAKRNNLVTMQEARELTKEDRVRIFFSDLQRLDELLEVVHRKALDGDPAAVHAEVKVLERRSRMVGLDAPRQLDMTLEVRPQRSTADALRASIESLRGSSRLRRRSGYGLSVFFRIPKDRPILPQMLSLCCRRTRL